MSPKTKSTVTGSKRHVICDYCGKEYEPRNFKEHTKRVNPGCSHREMLAKGQLNPNPRYPGPRIYVLCVMCYVFCVVCHMLCVMRYALFVMRYVVCVMCYVLCVM